MTYQRRIHLSILIILTAFSFGRAQDNSEKQAVMMVVEQIFEGMATNDGSKIRSEFTEDAQTFTVFVDKEGVTQKRTGSVQKFAEGTHPEPGKWR